MELSPTLSTIALIVTALLSVVAVMYARHAWFFCRDTEEFIKLQNKRSVSLSKLAEIEASLSELLDAYDALLASHKKLRARIGMRHNRAAQRESESDIPDPKTDPAGYKRVMRLKLGQGSLK